MACAAQTQPGFIRARLRRERRPSAIGGGLMEGGGGVKRWGSVGGGERRTEADRGRH